jgi:hypothetical protein
MKLMKLKISSNNSEINKLTLKKEKAPSLFLNKPIIIISYF